MNTIGSPIGDESIHEYYRQLTSSSNMMGLMIKLNGIYNAYNMYNMYNMYNETYTHQAAHNEKDMNSIDALKRLVGSIHTKQELLKIDNNHPKYSSSPKIDDLSYDADINYVSSHQIKQQTAGLETRQDGKNAKKTLPQSIRRACHRKRTHEEQCSIVLEACHPESSYCETAKKYDLPHQYISKWCKEHFGMQSSELKNCLTDVYKNDASNQPALLELTAIIHSNQKMKTKKDIFTLPQKKEIIKEACGINKSIFEVAKLHNISVTNIHRWCKNIYKVTLNDYRKNHRNAGATL
ncbi:hypothetical protein [Sodalis ligni]|uniref:Uncharacterized protein n=1 Tax=Sodalis ligni TaxID=2697027 RepID=A0A4R1NEQ0_9GAMM|nr:hypothetical protein [Sodalis ligni]TCL05349.1 hypothetical protein EZJ58_3525 [Sodalis ligni]